MCGSNVLDVQTEQLNEYLMSLFSWRLVYKLVIVLQFTSG